VLTCAVPALFLTSILRRVLPLLAVFVAFASIVPPEVHLTPFIAKVPLAVSIIRDV
jgi:hypothetical protein